jgi:hypothetical protein
MSERTALIADRNELVDLIRNAISDLIRTALIIVIRIANEVLTG